MKLLLETKEEKELILKKSVDIRELYGICVSYSDLINPDIEVMVNIDIVDDPNSVSRDDYRMGWERG